MLHTRNSLEHAVTQGLGLSYHATKGITLPVAPAPAAAHGDNKTTASEPAAAVAETPATPHAAAAELSFVFSKLALAERAASPAANSLPAPGRRAPAAQDGAGGAGPGGSKEAVPSPAAACCATAAAEWSDDDEPSGAPACLRGSESFSPCRCQRSTTPPTPHHHHRQQQQKTRRGRRPAATRWHRQSPRSPTRQLLLLATRTAPEQANMSSGNSKSNFRTAFERAAQQAGITSAGDVRQLYDRLCSSPAYLQKPGWNSFQVAVGGLGLTKEQVSALYHATKGIQFATTPPPVAAVAASSAAALQSASSSSKLAAAEPAASPAAPAASPKSNSWTVFERAAQQAGITSAGDVRRQLYDRLCSSPAYLQKPGWNSRALLFAVGGLGLTKEQVSALYHATKGIQFATTPPPVAAVAASSAAALQSASSSSKLAAAEPAASPAAPAASPKSNFRTAFERAAQQAGITSAGDVRQLYHRLCSSPAYLQKPGWNSFQAAVGGLGLTKEQVSALYHATKGIQFAKEAEREASCN